MIMTRRRRAIKRRQASERRRASDGGRELWSPGDIRDASPEFPLGTSGMLPRSFHSLIFILMVERTLLLALISPRAAATSRFVVILVWVLHRGSVRRKRATRGSSLSLSLRASIGLGHRRWACYPGLEGGAGNTYFLSVNSPVLGGHLTSWDRTPEGPNKTADFAWTLVTWHSGIFEYRV